MSTQPGMSFVRLRECTCEAVKHCLNHKVRNFILYFTKGYYKLGLLCINECLTLTHIYIHTYLIKLSLMSMGLPKHHPRTVATLVY